MLLTLRIISTLAFKGLLVKAPTLVGNRPSKVILGLRSTIENCPKLQTLGI